MEASSVSWILIILAVGMILGPSTARAATMDAPLSNVAWSPARAWTPGDKEGSVQCLGNGRLCVYEQGPELLQVFGPGYSATTIGALRWTATSGVATSKSRRVMGAAIWEHQLEIDGELAATILDFVDAEIPCFIRRIKAEKPIEFTYLPEPDLRLTRNDAMMQGADVKGGLLVETPIGKPCVPFGQYPIPFAIFNQFAWRGEIAAVSDATGSALHLQFAPGESMLYITGGPALDACMGHMRASLALDASAMLTRTLDGWSAFTAQGRCFARELPEAVPMRERLVQVLDDAAVMIKAQQAVEGGILAGYPYHLGYVRDQYGTHRGLAAMGHEEMSRDILAFYYGIFEQYGQIHNAQAFAIPGMFHVHENDEVEITGYITLQAFDYLARSGDAAFIKQIFPLLEWAWTVQQRHFIKDMLPFNGDETYVAGGILPRSTLNDGSAEATLLFIDSGRRLIDFAQAQGIWDAARIEKEQGVWARVQSSYRDHFWRNGRLITNNPERSEEAGAMPTVRHGVCEQCCTVQWTLRTEQGRYSCVECLNTPPLPKAEPVIYTLQSVSLTPLYFHSGLFTKEELRPQIEAIVQAYNATGKLPSRPDANVAVGYDYGLLLYALTELDHPDARKLYEKTLALADPTGAWAEYYRDHKPAGTRCRPWESAINIEALLHWIEKTYGWK